MPELRDFQRGTILYAYDGENFIPVLVTEDGGMYVLLQGADPDGDPVTVRADADGQLITILRGQSGQYVAVDDDGYMTTVIKGNYGGNLRTIWVDADGRLTAFPVDELDIWGQYVAVGNAELAARLGSPCYYERSGQVVFMEQFESGRKRWSEFLSGTGAAITLAADIARSGGYSVKLTGGSNSGRNARLITKVGINPTGRVGVAFSFSVGSAFDALYVTLQLRGTGTVIAGAFRCADSLGQWDLNLAAGGWQYIADVELCERNPAFFNTVKLVVDFDAQTYVSARVNAQTYDLSAYALGTGVNSYTPEVDLEFWMYSRSGYNDYCHIDDVVLTFAEP